MYFEIEWLPTTKVLIPFIGVGRYLFTLYDDTLFSSQVGVYFFSMRYHRHCKKNSVSKQRTTTKKSCDISSHCTFSPSFSKVLFLQVETYLFFTFIT